MSTLELIILAGLALSVFANVCYALFNERLSRYTNRWDLFRWVSAYQLFSQTPRNYRLSYRRLQENEENCEWKEVPFTVRRKWFHPIFFPEKLTLDIVYSCVDDVVRLVEAGASPVVVKNSFRFKTLRKYVERVEDVEYLGVDQLRIEEISGHTEDEGAKELFFSETEG
ncbi:MAG: hypothetical protein HKN33_08010 [Pyrinomonadaceae bacterium]|nr:hypothetical protein [Pyrinomonadaceae bacterium]